MIGQTVGRYRILEKLGEGGMGIVYRAEDSKLNRAVALKFIPPGDSSDPDLRKRFCQEAQAAAALSHANVCTVFEIDEEAGFLAMEFVEGETAQARVRRRPLPLPEALDVVIQAAQGLQAAHEKGVVHRDIKSTNLMVTPGGVVKITDFGLAQLSGRTRVTRTGTAVGTPAYMAPEQAQGRTADPRTDLWSLGVVLYELVTGQLPFRGDTEAAVVHAILHEAPEPVTSLRAALPLDLDRVLGKCLAKDPADRYQHAADLLVDLRFLQKTGAKIPPAGFRPKMARRLAAAALLLVAGLVAGMWMADRLDPFRRAESTAGTMRPFATEAAGETQPAWSPDGKSLAYLVEIDGLGQVFTRSLDSPVAVQITKSASNCTYPSWSGDGTRIYYSRDGDLWSSAIAGGEPRLEIKDAHYPVVSPDGKTLAFVRGILGASSLYLASTAELKPQRYARPPFLPSYVAVYRPAFSRDSSRLAVAVDRSSGGGAPELWVLPVSAGEPRRVPHPKLMTGGFDWVGAWAPSDRHALVGSCGPADHHLNVMDLETGAIRAVTSGTGSESQAAISPDGKMLAFTAGHADLDLMEIDLDRSTMTPLLATSRNEEFGSWVPSGAQYVYITDAAGVPEIWIRSLTERWARPIAAAGAGAQIAWRALFSPSVSPDGLRVAFDEVAVDHTIRITTLNGGPPMKLDPDATDQHSASWSPEGNWLVYRRLHAGRWELARIPLGGGQPFSLGESGEGGPMHGGTTDWSPKGDWICHLAPKGLELVSPDGKTRKLLSPARPFYFAFSSDGASLFALGRAVTRQWQLAEFDVSTGAEKPPRMLPVPAGTELYSLTRHPGGKKLLTTLSTSKQDIWIVEGFPQPAARRSWLPLWSR